MKNAILITLLFVSGVVAQPETLTNRTIVEMTEAGLSSEIIAAKILKSNTRFDVTAAALIDLKSRGVADEILSLMMERADAVLPGQPPRTLEPVGYSENDAKDEISPAERRTEAPPASPRGAIEMARTIAFHKSSAQPSRQNLEKALLRNPDCNKMNLTILRYKEEADLFVEIGYVSGSWLTHRYVYRIFDRRSGAVLAAGETTSWGSLAENLARHITRSLNELSK
jgi:hypothetical protein